MGKKLTSKKSGFTFVEVALFIAISTAMLVAFMATIATRIGTQRYLDTTNSFADFLRSVYSEVINVQNTRIGTIEVQNDYCTLSGQAAHVGTALAANVNPEESYPGRSGCTIHGKLISFGEDDKNDTVYVYDVIGRATDFNNPLTGASTTIGELGAIYADVLSFNPSNNDNTLYALDTAYESKKYNLSWSAWVEEPGSNGQADKFHGTVLIVRAPTSGAVRTFFLNKTLPLQQALNDNTMKNLSGGDNNIKTVADRVKGYYHAELSEYLQMSDTPGDTGFALTDVNFCINSADIFAIKSHRNDVRIKADGHNGTAVEVVPSDSEENKCAVD